MYADKLIRGTEDVKQTSHTAAALLRKNAHQGSCSGVGSLSFGPMVGSAVPMSLDWRQRL